MSNSANVLKSKSYFVVYLTSTFQFVLTQSKQDLEADDIKKSSHKQLISPKKKFPAHSTLQKICYSVSPTFCHFETAVFCQITVLNFAKFMHHSPNFSAICLTLFAKKASHLVFEKKSGVSVGDTDPRSQFQQLFWRQSMEDLQLINFKLSLSSQCLESQDSKLHNSFKSNNEAIFQHKCSFPCFFSLILESSCDPCYQFQAVMGKIGEEYVSICHAKVPLLFV